MYCPNCGKEVDEKDNFCKNCSKILQKDSNKKDNNNMLKYFVISLCVICVFSIVSYVVLNNLKSEKFDSNVFAIGEDIIEFMEANKGGELSEKSQEDYYKWATYKEYKLNREINGFKAFCTYRSHSNFRDSSKFPIYSSTIEFNKIDNNRKAKEFYNNIKNSIEKHYNIKFDEIVSTTKLNPNLKTYTCEYSNYEGLSIKLNISPTKSKPETYSIYSFIIDPVN